MNSKRKGILTLELSLLLLAIFTVTLMMVELIFLLQIKEKLSYCVEEAAGSMVSEIYFASKLGKDTDLNDLKLSINERAKKELGVDIDPSKYVSEAVFTEILKSKCLKLLKTDSGNIPKWLSTVPEFDCEVIDDVLYIKTVAGIKLPIISDFIDPIKLEIRNIQGAKGSSLLFGATSASGKKEDGEKQITICEFSYSGASKTPVYHTDKCMGRRKENTSTSKVISPEEAKILENGDLEYEGRIYKLCNFCKKCKLMKRED